MKYRHEWKYSINALDRQILISRLGGILKSDINAVDGAYDIRSLYFDTPSDQGLREKIDGVNNRSKYRLRYYNGNISKIRLEKKSKINGLCLKQTTWLTADETSRIIAGDYDWMKEREDSLLNEFYCRLALEGLRPKTIVDYHRRPYIYPAGNVRVTLDDNIRTGLNSTDFLNWNSVTVPVPDDPIILEVKWDEYLPDLIKNLVYLENRRVGAYSKYAACRMYD